MHKVISLLGFHSCLLQHTFYFSSLSLFFSFLWPINYLTIESNWAPQAAEKMPLTATSPRTETKLAFAFHGCRGIQSCCAVNRNIPQSKKMRTVYVSWLIRSFIRMRSTVDISGLHTVK